MSRTSSPPRTASHWSRLSCESISQGFGAASLPLWKKLRQATRRRDATNAPFTCVYKKRFPSKSVARIDYRCYGAGTSVPRAMQMLVFHRHSATFEAYSARGYDDGTAQKSHQVRSRE